MTWSALLLALLPIAWLVPNHHVPWLSAWQEGTALVLLAAAALAARRTLVVPWPVAALVAVAAAAMGLQWATGVVPYGGDVVIGLLYLGGFALAVALGQAVARGDRAPGPGLDALAVGVLFGAIASVGIALLQWQGLTLLGGWAMLLPPGSRPAGNVGQPNLLCSIAFLGVCAAAALHERGHIGRIALWAGWLMLGAGMVASGSRTGWLQAGVLLIGVALMRRRMALRAAPRPVALWIVALAGMAALWPAANDALLLSGHRSVAEQAQAGVRLPYWQQMLDAVLQQPWTGYGWQQSVRAQLATALDHPPLHRLFEQSHDLPLEFVLWFGVPAGLLLTGLVAFVLVQGWRRCADGAGVALIAGASGVLVHALVEYPLHFAYLLLPVGLFVGAASTGGRGVRLAGAGRWVVAISFAAVLGIVVRDYLVAEENERVLLLEAAHIGTFGIESPAPDLLLLDQLEAFLRAARVEPRAGMPAAALAELRDVAQRFAYAPALSRHALASALNGDPAAADRALRQLCAVHTPRRCSAALEAWDEARRRHPGLPAIDLAVPSRPATGG